MERKTAPKKCGMNCQNNIRQLIHWAERVQMLGRMLFCVLLTYGLISSVCGAFYTAGEALRFSSVLFLSGCLKTGIWLMIEYPVYHILSALLKGTAALLQEIFKKQRCRK